MKKITDSERQFVSFLLEKSGYQKDIPEMVKPMNDGGMGSISFDLKGNQKRISQIIAGSFKDLDGVQVEFELTIDGNGDLFELDLWKVDFTKLISIPKLSEIIITAPNNGEHEEPL